MILMAVSLYRGTVFAQIPVEVFAGNQKTTLDIMFFKFFANKNDQNSKILFVSYFSGLSKMTKRNNKPVTVFSSGNGNVISVAEALLKDAGINYSIQSNGLTEIKVSGDSDVIKARKILVDLEELDFQDNT